MIDGTLTEAPANLFKGLFSFRPKQGRSSNENFLTEAFAYVLRTDRGALDAWLSTLLGEEITGASCEVVTRGARFDSDAHAAIYPDLILKARFGLGRSALVYCEHKWDSPFNPAQMTRYQKLADADGAALVFVGASHRQQRNAAQHPGLSRTKSFIWEHVSSALNRVIDPSPMLTEFLEFLNEQGLGMNKPITAEVMQSYLDGGDLLPTLRAYSNKLLNDFDWNEVPKRYGKRFIHDAYGRIGIRFETQEWRPALTVGFLHDPAIDHRVTLIDRKRGIDLMFRLEAEPKHTKKIDPVKAVISAKRGKLLKSSARVLIKGDPENGNAYSLVIMQETLANVIGKAANESDQLQAIHKRLTKWLELLFADGELEAALKQVGLNSK